MPDRTMECGICKNRIYYGAVGCTHCHAAIEYGISFQTYITSIGIAFLALLGYMAITDEIDDAGVFIALVFSPVVGVIGAHLVAGGPRFYRVDRNR